VFVRGIPQHPQIHRRIALKGGGQSIGRCNVAVLVYGENFEQLQFAKLKRNPDLIITVRRMATWVERRYESEDENRGLGIRHRIAHP
jgi:hypothetical protein